ncbi:MAG: sugar ABC transporter substrate-binding protein [Gemmatimonadota bacterium]|nr:sugar ABC transporter substrate-binding protein [Gemmatimonadota bacterium]
MRGAAAALALAAFVAACDTGRDEGPVMLRLWALGREGEDVRQLIPEFERRNPGIRVRVQQMPWTAAHEKLLTAHVGESTPDVSQLGNTWVPEFAALGALEPLEPWVARSAATQVADFFPGIWATNIVDDTLFGVPWYVDTRVLFYRRDILARAGHRSPPKTWDEWVTAMERVKALGGQDRYPILLPIEEWAQPVIFGLQNGAPILRDGGRYGAFSEPRFREAFDFYISLFRRGLAPTVASQQVANVFQEFATGGIAMWITGPWNIGELRKRLPPELQDDWATTPLPGPRPPGPGVSNAGGSSLVIFRGSRHKAEAWKLIEFLTATEQQRRFFHINGDLPARESAWRDTALTGDPHARAFLEQLRRAQPMPKVPEWEQIATRVAQAAEQVARGRRSTDEALAALDRDVNAMLEKRRWMLARR